MKVSFRRISDHELLVFSSVIKISTVRTSATLVYCIDFMDRTSVSSFYCPFSDIDFDSFEVNL